MFSVKRSSMKRYGLAILVFSTALVLLWPNLIRRLFASDRYEPHGYCFLWEPGLVWLHVLSDVSIGASYVAISFTLAYLVYRARRDIPFHWVFLAFGAFIIACGSTHFMEVWTLWIPIYWFSGSVKLVTAVASVATAVVLPPLVPKSLALVQAARLSGERKQKLEAAHKELEGLYAKSMEIDQLKTDFFANVSHELRTPLTLILGPTRKLLAAGNLSPEQRHDLEVVERNARTLLSHVNNLLDISKLDVGKMGLAAEEVDLAGLVRLTASHFETLAAEKEIDFSVDTPPSVPARADAEKLQRVFMNLLSNAFKFTPRGGTVHCVLGMQGDHAVVSVEDSGPGVRPELRTAIFERFRQGDSSATRPFGGTGLGLAIAKEFVELHGGTITVDDAPGGGALFRVMLPLGAPASAVPSPPVERGDVQEMARHVVEELRPQAEKATDTMTDAGQALVLIVEDNPDMSRFIAGTLAAEYRIAVASDGQEGLAQALALHPDLILSDVMMPQMSGDQLVREVRKYPELSSIPMVLLTARADDELRVELLRAGAQDYLVKPFSPEELRVRVSNLIAMKRARDVLQQEVASQSRDVAALATEVSARKRELETTLEALRQAEEAQRFVAEVSGVLASSLDYHTTLQNVARLVVPHLADYCAIDILGEDRALERIALVHIDPSKEELARELYRRYPPDVRAEHGVPKVLRTGRPELVAEMPEALLAVSGDSEFVRLAREVAPRSYMIVPLVARGRTFGAVVLVMTASSGRRYGPSDLQLAEEVARRAAMAVDNARLYQEAQESIRARDEFLSIASHELKTPVTSVLGYAQVLQRRASRDQATNERDRRALGVLVEQAERLSKLILSLLDLSRLQMGLFTIERTPVDISTTTQRVVEGLKPRLGRHTLDLQGADRPLVVEGDEQRLEQVLHNLLENAIKYSPDGGRVTVQVEREDHHARISVSDQGIGIPDTARAHIFDRFYRGGNVDPGHISGFGIGLYVVKEIVSRHGGTIEVESTEGKGSTFTVRIPLADFGS